MKVKNNIFKYSNLDKNVLNKLNKLNKYVESSSEFFQCLDILINKYKDNDNYYQFYLDILTIFDTFKLDLDK